MKLLKVSVLLLIPLRVAGLLAQAVSSSNGSQGHNLMQGVMQEASQGRLRLKKWCGTALTVQVGRCNALEKLLVQTDLSRAMPVQQAIAEAAAAGAAVEHERVAAQVAQSSQKQQRDATKGSAEEAERDVKVLRNAATKLGRNSAEAHMVQSLLVGVIAEKKHSREKVAMFQVQKSAEGEQQKEILRLEQLHRIKQENVIRLMSQKVAGDQSIQVLTSALRDESAYLSDLQTTCKLGREIYKRMVDGPLQDLNRSITTLSGMHESSTGALAASQQQKQPQQQRQQEQQPKPKPNAVVASATPGPEQLAGTSPAAAADVKVDTVRSIPAPNGQARRKKRLQHTNIAAEARPVSHSSHPKHVQKASHTKHTAQAKQASKTTKHAPKVQELPSADDDDLDDSTADASPSHAQQTAQAPKHAPKVQALPAADDDLDDSTADTPRIHAHHTARAKQTWKMTKHAPKVHPLPVADDDLSDSTADAPNAAVPAQADASDTGDNALEAPPPQPIALRKRRVHKADTKRDVPTVDQGADKDSDADLTAELDADTASASRPLPKLGSRSAMNTDEPPATASVDSSDDDSSTETPVKLPPKTKRHRHSARRSPPVVAVVADDSDATSEAEVATAASPNPPMATASTHSDDGPVAVEEHAPKERSHGSLVQEGHHGRKKHKQGNMYENAQNPSLPQQYAAWDPDDVPATPATPQETSFEQMVADFKKDNDDSPAATPAQSTRRHVKKSASAPATSKDDDDETNYDDDDLPKHHRPSVVAELAGGWKAFIKSPKPKKTTEDGDIQMMNSLYSSDGSLPKAYSTWTPDDGSASQTSSSSDDAAESSGSDDVRAAAKELESSAAVKAAANELEGADSLLQVRKRRVRGAVLAASSARTSAAGAMLAQYAETLQSDSLKKLASSKLSETRLIDALKHVQAAPAPVAGKQQAQAEQWCRYFQANAQSATPVRSAIAQAERATAELAEAMAARSADKQEEAAQARLQHTVEQDVQGITAMLNTTEKEAAYFKVHPVSDNLGALAGEAGRAGLGEQLVSLEGAVQGFQYAHVELLDLLQTNLQKRNAVLHAHNDRLARLSAGDKLRESAVQWKRAAATQAQAGVEAARHRIQGIQAACDATLAAHGHTSQQRAEAHAAKIVLQLLQGQ